MENGGLDIRYRVDVGRKVRGGEEKEALSYIGMNAFFFLCSRIEWFFRGEMKKKPP